MVTTVSVSVRYPRNLDGAVSEESTPWSEGFASNELQEPVVPTSSANGSKLPCSIEELEDNAGVVGQSPDDSQIEVNKVQDSEALQDSAVFHQLLEDLRHLGVGPMSLLDPLEPLTMKEGEHLARRTGCQLALPSQSLQAPGGVLSFQLVDNGEGG